MLIWWYLPWMHQFLVTRMTNHEVIISIIIFLLITLHSWIMVLTQATREAPLWECVKVLVFVFVDLESADCLLCLVTNLYNQSEMSIWNNQPIRAQYYLLNLAWHSRGKSRQVLLLFAPETEEWTTEITSDLVQWGDWSSRLLGQIWHWSWCWSCIIGLHREPNLDLKIFIRMKPKIFAWLITNVKWDILPRVLLCNHFCSVQVYTSGCTTYTCHSLHEYFHLTNWLTSPWVSRTRQSLAEVNSLDPGTRLHQLCFCGEPSAPPQTCCHTVGFVWKWQVEMECGQRYCILTVHTAPATLVSHFSLWQMFGTFPCPDQLWRRRHLCHSYPSHSTPSLSALKQFVISMIVLQIFWQVNRKYFWLQYFQELILPRTCTWVGLHMTQFYSILN